MKIMSKDLKKGLVKLSLNEPEDVWYLSTVITPKDQVKAPTERRIKLGSEEQKAVRKKMTLCVAAEKIEYTAADLRVLGTITQGPEDIPRGEHHTLILEPGMNITITKTRWAKWQLEKLKEAEQGSANIILVLFDRESALFAKLLPAGYQKLSEHKGEVEKKDQQDNVHKNFWEHIAKQISLYDDRYHPSSIIAASPAFWSEYVKKYLSPTLIKKSIFTQVSDTNETTIQELLKKPELKKALEADRGAREAEAVALILSAMAKDKAAYGLSDVRETAKQGALQNLLVAEEALVAERLDGKNEIEELMTLADQSKTDIILISTKEATKQIMGLGGVAGIKRW